MSARSVRTTVSELFDRAASRLAGPALGGLKGELSSLKQLVADARPPRLLIAGRRGAGAAALLRILFGELAPAAAVEALEALEAVEPGAPAALAAMAAPGAAAPQPWGWRSLRVARGELRVLDLTGDLGGDPVGGPAPGAASAALSRAELQAAVRAAPPDLILFLCPLPAAAVLTPAELELLAEVRAWSASRHRQQPQVLGVVLADRPQEPRDSRGPAGEAAAAAASGVALPLPSFGPALDALLAALSGRGLEPAGVFPLTASPEAVTALESLCEALVESLPSSAQLQMVRLLGRQPLQDKAARRLTRQAAAVAAGIAAAPIPVADILPLTGLQISLVCGIAYAAGRELSAKAAKEFLVALGANVGAAFTLREAARALLKVALPAGGSAISAGVAFAGTWGVGEAARIYFVAGKPITEGRRLVRRFLRRSRRGGRAAAALPLSGPSGS